MLRRRGFAIPSLEVLDSNGTERVVCCPPRSRAEQAPHIIELRERITHPAIILGSRRRRKSHVLFHVADRCRRPPDPVCRLSAWDSGPTTLIRPRAAHRIATTHNHSGRSMGHMRHPPKTEGVF